MGGRKKLFVLSVLLIFPRLVSSRKNGKATTLRAKVQLSCTKPWLVILLPVAIKLWKLPLNIFLEPRTGKRRKQRPITRWGAEDSRLLRALPEEVAVCGWWSSKWMEVRPDRLTG